MLNYVFLAEEQARVGNEEVTLQEIYAQLMRIAGYSPQDGELAKQYELALELASVVPVGDQLELIQRLKLLGKKIIIVSDMYLDKVFIERLLANIGIDSYDELFVSSEYRKTKYSGQIWEEVRRKVGLGSILHIGDNLHADVNKPKRYGIDTFHYTRLLSERRLGAELSPDLVPFSLMAKWQVCQRPLGQSVDCSVWQELGATLGGMILWSFTNWLAQHIRGHQVEHIYFLARDAQVIEKAWRLRNLDKQLATSSSYLYISRKVVCYSACYVDMMQDGRLSDTSLTFLVDASIQPRDTYRIYLERIGLGCDFDGIREFKRIFGSLNRRIRSRHREQLKDYIQHQLSALMIPIFKRYYEHAMAYYHQEGLLNSHRKIAIVDLGWGGNIQAALQKIRSFNGITEHLLYGFYYGLVGAQANGRYYQNGPMFAAFFNAFNPEQTGYKLHHNAINLLENFHSADHETCVDFCVDENKIARPILKVDQDGQYQNTFNHSFAIFQAAALRTIHMWQESGSAYGVHQEWVSIQAACAAMYQVFFSPNRQEIKVLGGIKHSASYDHRYFQRLIPEKFPIRRHIDKFLYSGGWTCGVMSYWRNHRKKVSKRLYAKAIEQFNGYSEIIRHHLRG